MMCLSCALRSWFLDRFPSFVVPGRRWCAPHRAERWAIHRVIRAAWQDAAAAVCPLCAKGIRHHTNGVEAMSGKQLTRWDLHAVDDRGGVGLRECLAYEIWRRLDE